MSTTDGFYVSQSDKSRVKTLIVTDFLKVYFPIINNSVGKDSKEIIYIDLFCGPGKFEDGKASTPLALLDFLNSQKSDDIRNKIRIVFNDEETEYINKLNEIIKNHDVTKKLKFQITVTNTCANDVDVKSYTCKRCPIFSFIDPWGYKDVSVTQTWELVKNLGSDCVLFFNSNRFIMDINKEKQKCHFEPIFGEQLDEVVKTVNSSHINQKQKAQKIVELFSKNLISEMDKSSYKGYKLFVLPFTFEADDKEKVSHHILFITKSHKAIIEMKKVMVRHSNSNQITLLFDSKDQFQISMLHREDFVYEAIFELIHKCFKSNPEFINRTWKVSNLMEALDVCNMNSSFQVTPYTYDEVKDAINTLYDKGFVTLMVEPGKNIKKNITDAREFRLKREMLV